MNHEDPRGRVLQLAEQLQCMDAVRVTPIGLLSDASLISAWGTP
jgi:hypothetical protein